MICKNCNKFFKKPKSCKTYFWQSQYSYCTDLCAQQDKSFYIEFWDHKRFDVLCTDGTTSGVLAKEFHTVEQATQELSKLGYEPWDKTSHFLLTSARITDLYKNNTLLFIKVGIQRNTLQNGVNHAR